MRCWSCQARAPVQVVSVQYQVVDSQAFDDGHNDSSLKLAFYKLTNPHRQITSCVDRRCSHVADSTASSSERACAPTCVYMCCEDQ